MERSKAWFPSNASQLGLDSPAGLFAGLLTFLLWDRESVGPEAWPLQL